MSGEGYQKPQVFGLSYFFLLFVFGLLLVVFCTMDPLQRVSWRLGFICGLGTNFGKLVKKL